MELHCSCGDETVRTHIKLRNIILMSLLFSRGLLPIQTCARPNSLFLCMSCDTFFMVLIIKNY